MGVVDSAEAIAILFRILNQKRIKNAASESVRALFFLLTNLGNVAGSP
jgi:hypothetical protein